VCLSAKLLANFSESSYGRFEINLTKRQVSYVTYSLAYVNPLDAHDAVWIKWGVNLLRHPSHFTLRRLPSD